MTPAAITIEQLQIQRGAKLVIPGLDVEIPAGRITGLLGPSGSRQVDPAASDRRRPGGARRHRDRARTGRPARPAFGARSGT